MTNNNRSAIAPSSYPPSLHAISIHAPHAYAICLGKKLREWRSKPTDIRGWVLIHASKSTDSDHWCNDYGLDPSQLKRGHIIGAAWIHDCQQEGNAYGYVIGNFKLFSRTFPIRGRMPVFWQPANDQERAIFAQAWELIIGRAK